MIRVFVSAGEPSGDAHAAAVVRRLRHVDPGAVIEGIGGPHLRAAGADLLADADALAAIGLFEAARALPEHLRLLRQARRWLATRAYDVAILVDYPGFHLRVARAAHAVRTPVLQYVAPQVWAWGAWRARAIRRHVTRLAVVLPFEEAFFAGAGVAATFVGHPLLDADPLPSRAEARRSLGLNHDAPVLAVLPGSRAAEHRRLWPPFRAAVRLLRDRCAALQVVVAAPGAAALAGTEACHAVASDARSALAAADAALCKSGTVTLEAALAGVPMAVAYRMHPLTHLAARRLVRVRHIALVNLVAGRGVVPELVQGRAAPEALASAVEPLLDPSAPETRAQRAALAEVSAALGSPGAAERVSRLALEIAA